MQSNGAFGGIDPHKRASSPTSMVHVVKKPDITWKFHHVISWDKLRDTWQLLLEAGLWDGLEAYMAAVGVKNASGIRGKLHRGEDMSQVEKDDVYQRISWPLWNIVEGPGNRSDEGGSDLDLFTEGMQPEDQLRHTDIGLLWQEMAAFLQLETPQDLRKRREEGRNTLTPKRHVRPHNTALAGQGARLARSFRFMEKYKDAQFIPFVNSMWEVVEPAYVDKTAIGAWLGGKEPMYEKTTEPRTTVGNLPAHMRCTGCKKTFDTPNVVHGCNYPCPHCSKYTYIDFKNAA